MFNFSTFNSIIYGSNYAIEHLPKIECAVDGVAYFNITLELNILVIYNIECSIYKVLSPTSTDDRWIRQSEDLWTQDVLNFNTVELYDNYFQIVSEFLPYTLPGLDNDQFYSVEFKIRTNIDNKISNISPKVIIKIASAFI